MLEVCKKLDDLTRCELGLTRLSRNKQNSHLRSDFTQKIIYVHDSWSLGYLKKGYDANRLRKRAHGTLAFTDIIAKHLMQYQDHKKIYCIDRLIMELFEEELNGNDKHITVGGALRICKRISSLGLKKQHSFTLQKKYEQCNRILNELDFPDKYRHCVITPKERKILMIKDKINCYRGDKNGPEIVLKNGFGNPGFSPTEINIKKQHRFFGTTGYTNEVGTSLTRDIGVAKGYGKHIYLVEVSVNSEAYVPKKDEFGEVNVASRIPLANIQYLGKTADVNENEYFYPRPFFNWVWCQIHDPRVALI
ncbi:MAG: hypothetical protein GY718_14060 [Lentisphaerae bacterium]|nr:hypothetical protein [Lentisphaerota bacterium]